MTSGTDKFIGDQVSVTGQVNKEFFYVETNTDVHGFQWDHFVRTHLFSTATGDTLYVYMSDCHILINGTNLTETQLEFMRHAISYVAAAKGSSMPVKVANVSVHEKE